MILYGSPTSPYTRKVRIVLAEKRIACAFEVVSTTAPDTQVTRHNPLGKVPVISRPMLIHQLRLLAAAVVA